MDKASIYLFKNLLCAGILFLYYLAVLRNKRFHYYNRFYLLGAVAISLLIPFITAEWFTVRTSHPGVIEWLNVINVEGGETAATGTTTHPVQWTSLVVVVLFGCCLVACLVQLVKIYRLLQLKKRYPVEQLPSLCLINTDLDQAPFSFLSNLFWRSDLSLEEETGQQIFRHELTHIKQKHTWDKLFLQLVLCFCWMNPFYWLIRRELYLIHEFIADEKAVDDKDASAFAAMLLRSQYRHFTFSPAQAFAFSPVKRRLQMLGNSARPRHSYARRLMVLPLLLLLTGLFAFRIAHSPEQQEQGAAFHAGAKPFKLIVDAGHGGSDAGEWAEQAHREKDITLSLAQKIRDLSPQYNIEVVLTRSSDAFLSLKDRTELANREQADAFLSVHTNRGVPQTKNNSGVEVFVSDKNARFAESRSLGSALLERLGKHVAIQQVLRQQKEGIWVLQAPVMPSVLVQIGQGSKDVQQLMSEEGLTQLAKYLLSGVANFANHRNSMAIVDPEQPDTTTRNTPQTASSQATTGTLIQVKATGTSRLRIIGVNQPDSIRQGEDSTFLRANPLFVIDGKVQKDFQAKQLDPSSIRSIVVYKNKGALDKYGEEGRNGVVEISTHQAAKPE